MAKFATYFKVLAEGIELGREFWGFGRCSLLTDFLGIFLMFCLALLIFQSGLLNKAVIQFSCGWKTGYSKVFPMKECVNGTSDVKIRSPDSDSVKSPEESREIQSKEINDSKRDSRKRGGFSEDDESDVTALRKLVRKERNRANAACADLEKERMAAASATEEAMAMILRLQSEKSAIEIAATQFRRMSEQKHEYDQDNIQSLEWLVIKYQSDIKSLEDQLMSCKEKLALYMEDDALDVDYLPG